MMLTLMSFVRGRRRRSLRRRLLVLMHLRPAVDPYTRSQAGRSR